LLSSCAVLDQFGAWQRRIDHWESLESSLSGLLMNRHTLTEIPARLQLRHDGMHESVFRRTVHRCRARIDLKSPSQNRRGDLQNRSQDE
jgi:hypothetical protein